MSAVMVSAVASCATIALVTVLTIKKKQLHIWLWTYIGQRITRLIRPLSSQGKVHVLFCVVDHFEPISEGSSAEEERERMKDWLMRFPSLAGRHKDSVGRAPQHTWFYPGEKYNSEYLDDLVKLCQQGLGEIELHLHHGNDTSESLRAKLEKAIHDFNKHGALVTHETPPRQVYGFIHGNMALDNSMGDAALCGVNDEIAILKETGCYADFSMPTAPGISQTKKINALYYASDDRCNPKSHDTGIDVEVGQPQTGDLMIVQGPIGLNWSSRKYVIVPKIENSEIQGSNPPSMARISSWVQTHVHVKGRPEWIFVKISCHGAEDRSRDALLGNVADQMYSDLEREYRDKPGYALHYLTSRELYNIAKAAEAGLSGDPDVYRNYFIPPYRTHPVLTSIR